MTTERVLVTFLGGFHPKGPRGYQTTRYDFGNGAISDPTSFFADALLRHLRNAPSDWPTRLILCGTRSSMWDNLVERLLVDSDVDAPDDVELWDRLFSQASVAGVDDASLCELEARLAARFGVSVRCIAIPACVTEGEALGLVQTLAEVVGRGSSVVFDVTHGFRHLPMLALMAGLALEKLHNARIDAIYYGAIQLGSDGVSPVLRLEGWLQLVRWVRALELFDGTGDLSALAPVVQGVTSDPQAAGALRQAEFMEQLLRFNAVPAFARAGVATLRKADDPLARLFRPELERRLAWTREPTLWQQQRALARLYLQHGTLLRAAVTAFEAALSRMMGLEHDIPADVTDPKARDAAREKINERIRHRYRRGKLENHVDTAYARLRDVRNSLAHGSPPDDREARRAVESPESFHRAVERWLADLGEGDDGR